MLHTTGDVKTNLYEIDKQAKIYARLCENTGWCLNDLSEARVDWSK